MTSVAKATLVSYFICDNKGCEGSRDVGVFLHEPAPKLDPFEAEMQKLYPKFIVLFFRDISVYSPEEMADRCRVLAGVYDRMIVNGREVRGAILPELVVPLYVEDTSMVDKKYLAKFLAPKKFKPKKFMISPPIQVDPDPQEIMSEEFVRRLHEGVNKEEDF